MSTSTVALTIEMPSLDASLSWNACGPRWAPVRGLLAPFACPGCGAREDFARKGKRTRPRKLHTAAGTVELILWHDVRLAIRQLARLALRSL